MPISCLPLFESLGVNPTGRIGVGWEQEQPAEHVRERRRGAGVPEAKSARASQSTFAASTARKEQRRWDRLAIVPAGPQVAAILCENPPRVRGLAQDAEICILLVRNVGYRGLKAERFGHFSIGIFVAQGKL